jgi:hypothetical protein
VYGRDATVCHHGDSTRRGALRAGAVVAASGLAGCLSNVGFGGTSETVDVELANDDDGPRRLSVTATFDGATLFEESVTLDPGASVAGEFENPETAGEARVVASLEEGASAETDVRVGPGTGIRSVTVRADDGGDLSVHSART